MEQEILVEGKNFKLASIAELPEIVDFLANYLPDSVKVRKHFSTYNGSPLVIAC